MMTFENAAVLNYLELIIIFPKHFSSSKMDMLSILSAASSNHEIISKAEILKPALLNDSSTLILRLSCPNDMRMVQYIHEGKGTKSDEI